MNKERRKRLERLIAQLDIIREEIEEVRDEIFYIQEEEQESYDNMPESIQESDKGCTMQENIDELEEAYQIDLEDSIYEMQEYLQNIIDR